MNMYFSVGSGFFNEDWRQLYENKKNILLHTSPLSISLSKLNPLACRFDCMMACLFSLASFLVFSFSIFLASCLLFVAFFLAVWCSILAFDALWELLCTLRRCLYRAFLRTNRCLHIWHSWVDAWFELLFGGGSTASDPCFIFICFSSESRLAYSLLQLLHFN